MSLTCFRLSQATRIGVILTCLCLAGWSSLSAQDQEEDIDFSEMSLEDLLNVEVVTASKQAESIWDAPGVVTVITSGELETFGAKTLWEVLERVAGFQPLYSTFGGRNMMPIRGDLPTIDDNHVLYLYNGRPLGRNSWDGSNAALINAVTPISFIERIEIIRGPGSVLYGSNAYSGVVNIITKSAEENSGEISVAAGSDSSFDGEVYGGFVKGDFKFNAAVKVAETDGWSFESNDATGAPFQTDFIANDHLAINASLEYKGLSIYAIHQNIKDRVWTPSYVGYAGYIDESATAFNLKYEKEISENWRLEGNLTLSSRDYKYVLAEDFPDTVFFAANNDDTLLELTAYGDITEKLNIVVGALNNDLTGENPPPGFVFAEPNEWDYTILSAYFQMRYKASDSTQLILGGQYNKREDTSGKFSPRLGMIYNFSEKSGVKLLYGEAFRTATAGEQWINDPASFGNPDLAPETVSTADVQFYYKPENYQLAFTYYNSKQEDLISLGVSDNPDIVLEFSNLAGQTIQGLEFEFKYVPSSHMYFLGSVTSQSNEDDAGTDDITLQPATSVKLGFGYTSTRVNIGLFNSYFSAYEDNVILNPDRLDINPESDAYNSLSAKVAFNFKALKLSIFGTNVLDEDVWVPDVNTRAINTIPGAGPSSYWATLKYTF